MGIFRSIIRFFTGKTEQDDDDYKEERGRSLYRSHLYRTLPRLPGQNVHRTPYSCNSPSNLRSSENPPNKMLSISSFICRSLKFILGKLFWPISLLWPRKSDDQTLPVENPEPVVTFHPSLCKNLLISSPGNNSIRKPSLETSTAPINTSPFHDPQHHLTCKNCPVFSNAIFAPVKISPLNDPPPPLSHKNAVIKSVQAKSGQIDQVTVSVPKFTASLPYTTVDKAIQASSVLPKNVSVKSEQKKRDEEVKKKVIPAPAPVKTSPLHDPHHHQTCKNCPVFSSAIFAPVKTSPLNDPPPPLSHNNAVIKYVQAKSGQPDKVTVSVPKLTASLAYTSADKAIQASSVLPTKVSVKSELKKGNKKVKKKVIPSPTPAPVKTSPLHDPHHNLTCNNYPVFSNAIVAPVKTSPLNDPPPPLSQKNAVIKSVQAKNGQLDQVTVSVPKLTVSLAYPSADKAIQASSVLPKEVSVKSEPKKGNEEVKKEVVVIKKTMVVHEGRWIKHYSSRHQILLVGDGDFSFSACLATTFRCAPNIIATSLDSKEFLMENYNKAESNINELKKRQCKVLHGIDATKMAAHELLGRLHFDRIIFNFPFAGFFKTLSRDTVLRRHRKLVSKFLKNAKEMVSENGEIHISHKTNGFHVEWNLESMASSHGLRLIEAVDFSLDDYPGYNTKRGFGGDNNFECNPSKTYKFGIKLVRS